MLNSSDRSPSFASKAIGEAAAFLCENREQISGPHFASVARFANRFVELLFPYRSNCNARCRTAAVKACEGLAKNFTNLIFDSTQSAATAETTTAALFEAIPELYQTLHKDGRAHLRNDPAANSLQEIFLAYPGFRAICFYRLAHYLYNLEIPIIPRMITEYSHRLTGIDIHPGATIGGGFAIDHGTGVVIGETTIIGDDVIIYQGVTLGALTVNKALATKKRHPTIEDRVVIYANATILGGTTIIGADSIIGGNTWVTRSVPSNSKLYFDQGSLK